MSEGTQLGGCTEGETEVSASACSRVHYRLGNSWIFMKTPDATLGFRSPTLLPFIRTPRNEKPDDEVTEKEELPRGAATPQGVARGWQRERRVINLPPPL
ncbi:hypothetical protein TNCV_2063931 [Trichonephila clavipes]|nr:hypothetical protein TNCV_2063931 [Trichonephila clavipes]